ncbi:hypothetical protein T484DRAFT_1915699 [Baffinella frigidus]|nr:hypothetical protein T484DRAFT_1915699 [Cryptophyta sp. CCMP2293]
MATRSMRCCALTAALLCLALPAAASAWSHSLAPRCGTQTHQRWHASERPSAGETCRRVPSLRGGSSTAPVPTVWAISADPRTGKQYYFDVVTRATAWSLPPGGVLHPSCADQALAAQPAAAQPVAVAPVQAVQQPAAQAAAGQAGGAPLAAQAEVAGSTIGAATNMPSGALTAGQVPTVTNPDPLQLQREAAAREAAAAAAAAAEMEKERQRQAQAQAEEETRRKAAEEQQAQLQAQQTQVQAQQLQAQLQAQQLQAQQQQQQQQQASQQLAAAGPGAAGVQVEVAGAAAAAPVEVSPWQEAVDPGTGRTYYYNALTNEVTWELPAEKARAVSAAGTPGPGLFDGWRKKVETMNVTARVGGFFSGFRSAPARAAGEAALSTALPVQKSLV